MKMQCNARTEKVDTARFVTVAHNNNGLLVKTYGRFV